ncbi:MAG: hypothetical protein GY806_17445 [Gammaproteobacteria bacterium]|nr:hypothetical protein [Gammaproteobacteria bacterium]
MIIRIFLFCLIILICAQGRAQSTDEELRFYDVEVIIFKNLRGPKGKELILPVSSPSRNDEIFDIASPASIQNVAQDSYQLLASEQLQMQDRVEKIVKSPYYELLIHIGWRQPGLSLEESIPIWIHGGKIFGKEYVSIDNHMTSLINTESSEDLSNSNSSQAFATSENSSRGIHELEGKITISLSRYLHTYTDLVLRKPRLTLEGVLENPESQVLTNGQITEAHILDNYSLKEHRRMRSKRLHYLDNPEFSMLILITPFEVQELDTASSLDQ